MAHGIGMLALTVFLFGYYVSFELSVPFPRDALLPVAGAVVGLAAMRASSVSRESPATSKLGWLPAALAGLMVAAPVAMLLTWDAPLATQGRGYPVRGMTYNLHNGFNTDGRLIPNGAEVSGPGVNKKVIRKLYSMNLTEEQLSYANCKGARDPRVRVADMDLQGIDQVVVIPITMFADLLFVKNFAATALITRAYNDWVYDRCSTAPDRLFPAAVLPIHNPEVAAEELRQAAKRGFRLAMLRPVDI